jgi:hypothetical protein
MLVSLVGLTSAVASSFSTNVEDVESFTTSVSLTTPANPPVPFPPTLWVRGEDGAGTLDLAPPPAADAGWTKLLVLGGEEVDLQTDPDEYVTWRSPVAPLGGFQLEGDVTLFIDQDRRDGDRMSGSLFVCPPEAPAHSGDCQELVTSIGTVGVDQGDDELPDDFEERQLPFGRLHETIPEGKELRLKVTNRRINFDGILSTRNWHLLWGYRSDRQSRWEIAP